MKYSCSNILWAGSHLFHEHCALYLLHSMRHALRVLRQLTILKTKKRNFKKMEKNEQKTKKSAKERPLKSNELGCIVHNNINV